MGNSCTSSDKSKELILVFEGQSLPSDNETSVWSRVEPVLQYAPQILNQLQVYRGAVCEIKNAISNPTVDDCQTKAWTTVLPLVAQLKTYFDFSHTIGQTFVSIVQCLCSCDSSTMNQMVSSSPALVKQLAQLLDFALKFDDLKMTNAAIQNDFSYYRRTLSRIQLSHLASSDNNDDMIGQLDVDIDVANRMALFYAHPMPMLNAIIESTIHYVGQPSSPVFQFTTVLICTLVNACIKSVNNKYKVSDEAAILCLRVLVSLVVVYDHIDPTGAFDKHTAFDITQCIKAVKQRAAGQTECLLNILRYSTKHLNSDSTPKTVRALLAPQ